MFVASLLFENLIMLSNIVKNILIKKRENYRLSSSSLTASVDCLVTDLCYGLGGVGWVVGVSVILSISVFCHDCVNSVY